MEQEAVKQVNGIVYDKNRVWGRHLNKIAEATSFTVEQVSITIVVFCVVYLAFGESARTFCNSLLIGVPLFIFTLAPEEKPSKVELIYIYWAVFVMTTILDSGLQDKVPLYYLIKVILHLLLFLHPYDLADKIVEKAESEEGRSAHRLFSKEELRQLTTKKPSPPPEKPREDNSDSSSNQPSKSAKQPRSRASNSSADENNNQDKSGGGKGGQNEKTGVSKTGESNTSRSPWPQTSQMKSVAPSPVDATNTAVTPSNEHKVSDQPNRPAPSTNPMLQGGSPFVIPSNESTPSTTPGGQIVKTGGGGGYDTTSGGGGSASSPGAPVNAYDLEWEPKDKLVFNAPFDYAHLVYYIRLKNTCNFRIAYAIKSNAIPRVTASPPTGIIPPMKAIYIAVTVQKHDYDKDGPFEKDRLAFEYCRLYDDSIKTFQFKIFQSAPMKRRKNILVKYNP